jgi:uncharacterized membrane protein
MTGSGPTVPPPQPDSLNTALYRNIEALKRHHDEEARSATFHDRMARAITSFAGSFPFVYIHLGIVSVWVAASLGWIPGVRSWDPSFVGLAMVTSVEAIFLSTFVLITQNRMAEESDRRAALDLQVNLLAEHEVTRLIRQTSAIAEKLGIEVHEDIEELKRDIAPEAVLDVLESVDQ